MLDFDYEVVTFDMVEGRLHRDEPVAVASGSDAMCMAVRLARIKPGVMVLKKGGTAPVAIFGEADADLRAVPERTLPATIVRG